ncbi:MAG: relaxase/mobilization nuclease domain-containing protein [Oscillospiraceae bacterium]|nr:relaxase/mobilization nuclease domain-containing protein [Oscillospiraceae bacterium]
MDTLLCGEDDFAIACMRANLHFGKNNLRGDVKSHHYIISYDPRDAEDHGLTVDRAQELGVEFCRKNFPGHQAMIVTHPDGHNHSGNIHTHIVINSLRIEDVPRMAYMDKACDMKAGMKHRCTSACLRHLRAEVMEMCQENGLYQIDLLGGTKDRVTNKEYLAQRRGQQKLDEKTNGAEPISDDKPSASTVSVADKPAKPSKYDTDKEKLRKVIRSVLDRADSMESFTKLLLEQGVSVKESRGRFSYLSADRPRPITDRMLGDDFLRQAVLDQLAKNARLGSDAERMNVEQTVTEQNPTDPIVVTKTVLNMLLKQTTVVIKPDIEKKLERVVDIDKIIENGKGEGYRQWALEHNIKQMAGSMSYLSRHGINNYDELKNRLNAALEKKDDLLQQVKTMEGQIREKKELRDQILKYGKNKEAYDQWRGMKDGKKKDAFYQEHRGEIILAEAAEKYLRAHGIKSLLPSPKKIQAEIEDLISRKAILSQEYQEAKKAADELGTVKHNVDEVSRKFQQQKQIRRHRDREISR